MRTLLRLLATLWLLTPLMAGATRAIIYQPQLRDRTVTPAQWQAAFQHIHEQGFDTLVLQWTRYGDAFADRQGHAWLQQRVLEARAAGLHIVLGLNSDPAFFQRQEASSTALGNYLRTLARRNESMARQWSDELGADAIAGWYLPIEVDDRRWRDPGARQQLEDYLATEYRQLQQVMPRPVYVTSFFAGNMAPARYAQLLQDIQRSGVRAWVQDGAGTGRLDDGERQLYLEATTLCTGAHVQGIVYEVFRQTGGDKAFTAAALSAGDANAALAQRAPCAGDSVFFELRYLPELQAVMKR